MPEPSHLTRTRDAYDAIAADYATAFCGELAGMPLERALYAAFAELVLAAGGGPVADLGCGPGHVTAHLTGLGLDVFGVDLSPGMVALARATMPAPRFEVGSLTALDVPDGSLAAAVALYSLIHLPPTELPAALRELHRVVRPGGQLLVASQVGGGQRHRAEAFGHAVALDYCWPHADDLAAVLTGAGFTVHARLLREPARETEQVPRVHLLARR
ncbi:class I SAM-dependent methyltransferase [Modestobacter marinus]|uniref:class I SAM-dependent methyltransferase n=1 Tax=Modestobacter marinus TaxID=477641 RepID=UPI001C971C0C|nr:class I SAM-dependent methyltransferase [Modestobacter marinus]